MRFWSMIVLAIVGCLFVFAFSIDQSVAELALKKQGFTEVEVTSKVPIIAALFGCGEDDLVAFKANATNVNGDRVEGITLCVGLFKGVTTRF